MAIESRPEQARPEVISPAIATEKFVTKLQSMLARWQQVKTHDSSKITYTFSLSSGRTRESLSVERGREGIDSVSLNVIEETPPSEIKHLQIRTGLLLNPQTAIFNPDGSATLFGDDPKDSHKTVIMQIMPQGHSYSNDHFSPAK